MFFYATFALDIMFHRTGIFNAYISKIHKMKKTTKLVLEILKPKSKALGFNKDELEGVAADIADNLELEDDASDEDVNAKITEAVDAAIPYLKLAQKVSNRVIQGSKKPVENNQKEEEPVEPPKHTEEQEEKVPAWAQALITQNKALQTEILGMKAERESDGRRSKLKALLKDTGTFGKSILKQFDKMKFENESEFEEFYDGVVEDLGALNQERANEGLAKLGATATGGSKKKEEDKPEPLSEKQIDELANSL